MARLFGRRKSSTQIRITPTGRFTDDDLATAVERLEQAVSGSSPVLLDPPPRYRSRDTWHPPVVILLTDNTAIRVQAVVHTVEDDWGISDTRYVNVWSMRQRDGVWEPHEPITGEMRSIAIRSSIAQWPSGPYPGDIQPPPQCQCSRCSW